ncbi:MAG: 3-methyl-2-oxobutanoate hydroxymethyltransferase [Desulfurococcales archaeon]|nr:3-methyl-2-oxobutanoate hydroxymethyltransferase [Desulfurococcales archaeon]
MKGKILPHHFLKMKKRGEKIVMVTAYTFYQARVADDAGVDGILVGDSLGMVIMGYGSTLPVTLEDVRHHLRAVVNAGVNALIVADMPFMTYEVSKAEAVRNAGVLMKEGADAVKLEGGSEVADIVEALVKAGIPVMGHVGLNPQKYLVLGGYKLRGRKAEDGLKVLEDAKSLQDAGAFSVVIENTVSEVAAEVTGSLSIPTICIGAGPHCDGQILVIHDVLGLNPNIPYFARKYLDAYTLFVEALKAYANNVRTSSFPGGDEFKHMQPEELVRFKKLLNSEGGD